MISLKDIDKLAELTRIAVNEEDKVAITSDIEKIVAYISELQNVEVKDGSLKKVPNLSNIMREDSGSHERGLFSSDLLSASQKRKGNFFTVKKII